jgi:hypothetical protein
MVDFSTQAQGTVAASAQTPSGSAEMITVFLGNNDVCAASLDAMTDPGLFEASYRAGLDVLASSDATRNAQIHVSGLPAIYWLWNAKRDVLWCRFFAWPFVPCENLLDNARMIAKAALHVKTRTKMTIQATVPIASAGKIFTASSVIPITRSCAMCWTNTVHRASCRMPGILTYIMSGLTLNT